MIAKVLAVAAAGISAVSATCTYPPPLTDQLAGNSVTRPDLTDPATIGEPFNIVWDATGLGPTVSLILLQGPSTNIQYLETIVSGAPNTGSYSWTPECSLTPASTGYGIMMQDESTCKFQWSTQFGLNAGSCSSSSSAQSSSSTSAPPMSSSTAPPSSSHGPPPHSSGSSPPPKSMSTSYGGGSYGSNGTAITSTSTYYPPANTGSPSASGTYKPVQSNDAGRFGMNLVGAAVALAAAMMVL